MRHALVHVDFVTRERTPKDSAHFLRSLKHQWPPPAVLTKTCRGASGRTAAAPRPLPEVSYCAPKAASTSENT